jgi:hypothetical protein
MRFTLKTLAVLLVALFTGAVFAASFTAALDRDAITLGENVTLSLKFDGVQPSDAPAIPDIAGLQFQYIGPSSSFTFINGQTSSSITYNYTVTAQHDGQFTIPALRADINGQPFISLPLTLTVSKVAAPPAANLDAGDQVAFMKFVFPKNKVYVGEAVVGRLELYLRDDVQNFGNFQLTASPTDGFNAGKNAEPPNQRRRVQIGNHSYVVIPIAVPLTAIQTGQLTLGPFTASAVVVTPSQNQGGDPFFRMFNQGEQKQVTLATEPFTVESLPLPEQNKPANFSGAVGDFMLTVSAGPTTLTVGDPITVRVQISGSGALDAITLPTQDTWNNFKTYPPTTKLETTDQLGFQGTKTFEQIVSPLNSDVQELPPFTFSFFNPNDGQYHTLTQPATPLTVHSAGASALPTIAGGKNSSADNTAPLQDILPIKENLGALETKTVPLVARPEFLALQSLPLIAIFAAFVWRKRADNLANNPRLRRQRAVAQLVNGGLGDLNKFAAENKSNEFFAMLFRLLQEQLGERLDCPATSITEADVDKRLIYIGATPITLESLRELFQLCNQARYAPIQTRQELTAVASKFKKVVGELQNLKA